jgi:hypothetical protein
MSNPYAHFDGEIEHIIDNLSELTNEDEGKDQIMSFTSDDTYSGADIPYALKTTKRELLCDADGNGLCVRATPYTDALMNDFFTNVYNSIAARLEIGMFLKPKELKDITKDRLILMCHNKKYTPNTKSNPMDDVNTYMQRANVYWADKDIVEVDDIVRHMDNPTYSMSESELEVMVNLLHIHIFVVTRKGSRSEQVIHIAADNDVVIESPLFLVFQRDTITVSEWKTGDKKDGKTTNAHMVDVYNAWTRDKDMLLDKTENKALYQKLMGNNSQE